MKSVIKDNLCVPLVLLGGAVGVLLRQMRLAGDSAGLLVHGSVAGYLLTVWTVLIVVALLVLTRKDNRRKISQTMVSRLGDILLTVFLLVQAVLTLGTRPGLPDAACAILSVLAVIPMLRAFVGKKTNHILLCVYTVVALVLRFRAWSLNPQIAHYSYQLLCGVVLMLATYHRAAADLNMGQPKAFRRWSLLGAYLCVVSMTDKAALFYLAMGLWLLCGAIELPKKQTEGEPSDQAA